MPRDRGLKTTFGSVSDIYNSSRPSYPLELVGDVVELSEIPGDGKILEVGCGPGKATILFGERGYDILGLDISNDLVKLAKKNTSHLPNVRYKNVSFEEANLEAESFNLVLAAQSWHWMDPKTRYRKSYKVLRDSGSLAIFWKSQSKKSDIVKKVRELYKKHCPKFLDDFDERQKYFSDNINASGLFEKPDNRTYETELKYSREKFMALVQSMSFVVDTSKAQKNRLLESLVKILDGEDVPLLIPYKYHLLISKKVKE